MLPSTRKKLFLLVTLGVLGVAAGYLYPRFKTADDKGGVQQSAVSKGEISQTVRAIGTLTALRTVRVGSQVSGTIKALYVDYNSVVVKDQILAELDSSLLETQVSVQEANLARLESDVDQQRQQLLQEQRNLDRSQAVFEKGVVSAQQLEAAKLQVRARAAQIAAIEKQKVQAQAQLNQARLNVSYCTIRAPIDGVIVSRFVDAGQTVQASVNTPTFFTLATDLTTLKISAGVDEADIGRIRRHMPVTFAVEAYRGVRFDGVVEAIRLNAQIQNNVVTYPVWVHVPNGDLKLRPGMTANLDIVVDAASEAVLVPNAALHFRPTANNYQWLGLTPPEAGPPQRIPTPELAEPSPMETEQDDEDGDDVKIDARWPAVPKRITPGQVWLYDENDPAPDHRLRRVEVRTGISDAQFTEVVSGDIAPGTMVVTAVTPPPSWLRPQSNSIFGQPGRSFGGMTPAGPTEPVRLAQPGRGGGGRGGGGRGGR